MIGRCIYRYLAGEELTPENSSEQQVDERIECLMQSDDPKPLLDLRKNNGKIADKKLMHFRMN